MASLTAAAEHVFLSTTRFRELVDTGIVTKATKGQYDLNLVRKETFAHLRADKGQHGNAALSSERAGLAHEQRETAMIKNAIARGEVVSIRVVQREVESDYAVHRERILSIPGKSSDACEMRGRDEIELILRAEINEALDALSNPSARNWGRGPAGGAGQSSGGSSPAA